MSQPGGACPRNSEPNKPEPPVNNTLIGCLLFSSWRSQRRSGLEIFEQPSGFPRTSIAFETSGPAGGIFAERRLAQHPFYSLAEPLGRTPAWFDQQPGAGFRYAARHFG